MPFTDRKATRQQIKSHNKRLILRTIYERGEISRAGIARATHLTRPTVSSIVAELIDETLVVEVGQQPSEGGKPATLLGVQDDSFHLIGIDLAEDAFRGCLVNLRGKIQYCVSLTVGDKDGEAALSLVYQLVDELMAVASRPLLGIGIGTPGLMDAENGIVRRSVNLNWRDLPLRQLLSTRYDLPVYIANDTQAAAQAEYTFGTHKDITNFIVVKIGVGISSGIIINGQLFHGDGSGAGEIGHVRVVENGARCRCGSIGCLETVVSSPALLAYAKTIAQTDPASSLAHFADTPDALTFEALQDIFPANDPAINARIAEMGRYVGQSLAHMVGSLNINHIVIAGKLSSFGDTLLKPMQAAMIDHAPPFLVNDTTLSISELGQDIVVLGASALLLTYELGII